MRKEHRTINGVEQKHCYKCGRWKPLNKFFNSKSSWDSLTPICKECRAKINRSGKENLSEENKIRLREKNKSYLQTYYKENKKEILSSQKIYYRKNTNKCNKRSKDYFERNRVRLLGLRKEKMKKDLQYRISCVIRSQISGFYKNKTNLNTEQLLGCTFEQFHKYISSQFHDGMTEQNYGIKGWHLDHKIPLNYFDLSDPEQFKQAWHYTNLRPLWWYDNLSKSSKVFVEHLVSLPTNNQGIIGIQRLVKVLNAVALSRSKEKGNG